MARKLGRRPPTDWRHVERYPLTTGTWPEASYAPVVIGVNWYSNFDDPIKRGRRWYIGETNRLGRLRGGHAVCLVPYRVYDTPTWWRFYDQGVEGACVGFALSRMMSLLNRERYDARWLYKEAQKIDEWPGEDYEGTSVRAGAEVLRTRGHVPSHPSHWHVHTEVIDLGIAAYRWAEDVDQVINVLNRPYATHVPIANSWGDYYPKTVWMPVETLERLLNEYGEACIVTDR